MHRLKSVFIFFFLVQTLLAVAQKKSEKPNVLFIFVDDLRPDLGCYGNKIVKSPNLDKLASESLVFLNQYVQVPTCGASRCSILTGMLPRTKTHISNDAIHRLVSGQPEGERPETFIHQLRRNGYYTVGIGKVGHYVDGLLYEYTGDPAGAKRELPYSWDELLFNSGKWKTGWNAFFGFADGSNRQGMEGKVKPYERGEVGDEGYVDGLTADLAVDELKALAGKGTPFFMGVGFFKPHLPFTAPAQYWDLYNESELSLTRSPGIPEQVNPASLHNSNEFNSYKAGDEKTSLTQPVSDAYARKLIHAYYASVSYTDAQIGKVLKQLEQLGLSENTIVVVWGDHGWHLGDHGVWGKHTLFESALRSPLIIKAPGKGKGVTENIVSSIDIYPSLMELCGVPMPHKTDGTSFAKLFDHPHAKWNDASYGYFNNGISLRTKRYRLTRYYRDAEPVVELYDHREDPFENHNIAGQRQATVKKLMPLLEKGNTGLYKSSR